MSTSTCSEERSLPNILITGTPGTGKTTHASTLADLLSQQGSYNYSSITVGDVVKSLPEGSGEMDEEFDTFVMNEEGEDRLLDSLEATLGDTSMGFILDHHTCDLFPKRWFDLVVVLRSSTEEMFDRLNSRGYSEKKVGENLECEIMGICLEEARESYDEGVVQELKSDCVEDMDNNCERIVQWIGNWIKDNR